MAILNAAELAELRRALAKESTTVDWNKPTINLGLQAIEDFIEGGKATMAANIDMATSPFVFTAAQKKSLVKHYFKQKFDRGG